MKYKLHHAEAIRMNSLDTWLVWRRVVPGGWIYYQREHDALTSVFVPDPTVEIEETE